MRVRREKQGRKGNMTGAAEGFSSPPWHKPTQSCTDTIHGECPIVSARRGMDKENMPQPQ